VFCAPHRDQDAIDQANDKRPLTRQPDGAKGRPMRFQAMS